ncbi:MAG: DUF739 family protein [Clostridia bacterium]|jgi:hypothetical protein|nr:DUF739 family protein [Clostridia bacterium]
MKRYNYEKLKSKIKEKFQSQSDFAQKLNISYASLNNKLNQKTPFEQDEIMRSIEIFRLEPFEVMEYFFTEEVEKTSTKSA